MDSRKNPYLASDLWAQILPILDSSQQLAFTIMLYGVSLEAGSGKTNVTSEINH